MSRKKENNYLKHTEIKIALKIAGGFRVKAAKILGITEEEIDKIIRRKPDLQNYMEECLFETKEKDRICEKEFTEYIELQRLRYRKDQKISVGRKKKRRKKRKREYLGKGVRGIVAEKHNGMCAICKSKIEGSYVIDHIKPASKGGDDDIDNLQLTCSMCNMGKFIWTQEEYIAHCMKVAKANTPIPSRLKVA